MLNIEIANMMLSEGILTLKEKFETYLKTSNRYLKYVGIHTDNDVEMNHVDVFYSLKGIENSDKQNITIHFDVDREKMEGKVIVTIDTDGQKHKEYKLGTYHLWSAKSIDDLANSTELFHKIKDSITDYNKTTAKIVDKITAFFKNIAA